MLLQYFHSVNRRMNGRVCVLPPNRTVNWPSVPAATLFPQAPKSLPTRATKPSGALVPGHRFVTQPLIHAPSPPAPVALTIFLLRTTVQRQLWQRNTDALCELP